MLDRADEFRAALDRLDEAADASTVNVGAIPAGMVAWPGGDSAPEDWDGGPVWTRNCSMLPAFAVTDCDHLDNDADIIAYTRCSATPSQPSGADQGEVERVEKALIECWMEHGKAHPSSFFRKMAETACAALTPKAATAQPGASRIDRGASEALGEMVWTDKPATEGL